MVPLIALPRPPAPALWVPLPPPTRLDPLGSVDGSSHLLVLQRFNVQISLARPRCAGNVAQLGCGEVQGRLAVGEGPDHTRASPDLAQKALERVVGADAPPVLVWKGVVGQGLFDPRFS